MKTSKTKQSVLIAILVIALVTVFMPARTDTAQASVSDAQYAALKGTWATGSSRYPGYGPQNYVRFTKYKVNYYYQKKKGGKLIFERSADLVSAEQAKYMTRYKVEGEYGTYYYELWRGKEDVLDYTWNEDGEWGYSGGSSLTKVYSTPAKVKGVVASKIGRKTVSLKWSKAKNAKYYQILKVTKTYRSGGKTKYKYKKVGTTKNCRYKVKGLKSGKTYKFRVRAVNGSSQVKRVGKMSKVKKVRTK